MFPLNDISDAYVHKTNIVCIFTLTELFLNLNYKILMSASSYNLVVTEN